MSTEQDPVPGPFAMHNLKRALTSTLTANEHMLAVYLDRLLLTDGSLPWVTGADGVDHLNGSHVVPLEASSKRNQELVPFIQELQRVV